MNYPKVSIVILNWNGLKDTIECLESLKNINYTNYEVIVVDNGSKGDDADVLAEKYKNSIRVIRNKKNLGFTEGNNVAMRLVLEEKRSDYTLLLNNDTIVDKNMLNELVKVAQSDKKIGIVGPKIHFYHEPKEVHSMGGVINLYSGFHYVGRSRRGELIANTEELHYYSGCCILIKNEALRKVGLFDPIYFYYNEDVDLGFRIYRAGYKILCAPKAKMWHKEGQSVGGDIKNPFTAYYESRNRLVFARKFGKFHQLTIFILLHFARMIYSIAKNYSSEKKLIKNRLKGTIHGLFKNKYDDPLPH